MKRKIVLHGPSTLTVSLPSNWARKFNVKKGDELNIEEFGNELKISVGNVQSFVKKELEIGNFGRVSKSKITSSYRQGCDSLLLKYKDSQGIKTIQELISKDLIGYEVVQQGTNSCVIEDLAGSSSNEFETALRRVWLLISAIAGEGLEAVRNENFVELKGIQEIDNSVNRFCNYCLRLLVKQGHSNYKKTPLYYHLLKELEKISDEYSELYESFAGNENVGQSFVLFFSEVNECFEGLYKVFYKYDEQRIDELFTKTKKLNLDIIKLNRGRECYLSNICKSTRGLLSVIVEMNV